MDDRDDSSYARAPEPEALIRICRSLNDAGARYVLIGGFALIAHGATRFTKDIDLLIDDSPDNVARVRSVLCRGRRRCRADRAFLEDLIKRRQSSEAGSPSHHRDILRE